MLVSIIIPVYKVEKYIEKCIRSVINQSYTKSLECIIVNDCSPDNSIAIVESILKNYHGEIQFIIKRRSINGGLSAARNTGILMSRGTYLYFLDSDDWLRQDCFEKILKIANKYPHAEIIQAGAEVSNLKYAYLSLKNKTYLSEYSDNKRDIKKRILDGIYPSTVWNKLIKREWIIKHNLFFKDGLLHEDDYWDFFAAKCINHLAVCKYDTYIYNLRQGSITQAPDVRNITSRLLSLKDFLLNIDDFCVSAQRRFIYRLAYSGYADAINDNYRTLFSIKLHDLSSQCDLFGKCVIRLTLYLPYFIHKKYSIKYFFKRVLSRLM